MIMRGTTRTIGKNRKTVARPGRRRISSGITSSGGGGKAGGSQGGSSGPATDYSKLTGDAGFE
jgi:hypothetical protein